MSKFIIYKATSPFGFEVEIMTDGKPGGSTYKELADEEMRIMRMEAAGWKVKKAGGNVPLASERPAEVTTESQERHCATCGSPLTYREGTSKTGKPYKGYFCPTKGHPVIWTK